MQRSDDLSASLVLNAIRDAQEGSEVRLPVVFDVIGDKVSMVQLMRSLILAKRPASILLYKFPETSAVSEKDLRGIYAFLACTNVPAVKLDLRHYSDEQITGIYAATKKIMLANGIAPFEIICLTNSPRAAYWSQHFAKWGKLPGAYHPDYFTIRKLQRDATARYQPGTNSSTSNITARLQDSSFSYRASSPSPVSSAELGDAEDYSLEPPAFLLFEPPPAADVKDDFSDDVPSDAVVVATQDVTGLFDDAVIVPGRDLASEPPASWTGEGCTDEELEASVRRSKWW